MLLTSIGAPAFEPRVSGLTLAFVLVKLCTTVLDFLEIILKLSTKGVARLANHVI